MKSPLRYLSFIVLALLFIACQGEDKSKKSNAKDSVDKEQPKGVQESSLPEVKIPTNGTEVVDVSHIETLTQEELIPFLTKYEKRNAETMAKISTEFGDIEIQLYAGPRLHRLNFVRLAKLGYFNTTCFHRVAENFVIQGGNSDQVATSQMRKKIGNYLIPNEFKPIHRHKYGAVAAAKFSQQNVSNASSPFEFYIVTKEDGAHHLDEDHTVFGRVVSGMDVAEKISSVEVDGSEWPISDICIEVEVYKP
ncbi:MAG: peptidylprolyl isomerase [Flavobacteriaceae bacterium]|nr:peptidylprolyl isomerase [Flavobacteriaceae bacterium]